MSRISVTLHEEQDEILEEKTGDDGEYDSKSEAVRSLITEHQELTERIERLEIENERLHRERRQLLEQREENTELVKAVKEERTIARKKAEAGLWTKTKWALFGMPDDETENGGRGG